MENIWSTEVDVLLSAGRSLEDVGVRNWALSRGEALAALAGFAQIGIAVSGGDVYSVNGSSVELSYDNWYCDPGHLESDAAYIGRSIATARDYILNYPASEGVVLFAMVPRT